MATVYRAADLGREWKVAPLSSRPAVKRRLGLSRRMRRLFVDVHFWLGLALSLVMTIWFLSGFVMMYADYTTQIDEALRLERMESLDTKELRVGPVRATRALGLSVTDVTSVRLHVDAERPVWRIRSQSGEWRSVFADSGRRLGPIDADQARRIASSFRSGEASGYMPIRLLDGADVWTLSAVHEPAFPLYRVDLDDGAGTRVYVSRESGLAVNVHSSRQRALAFAGAVLHYLYLPELRGAGEDRTVWLWAVVALSGVGGVLCISGLWLGLIYLRSVGAKRASPQLAWSPFRGWMKWHHYAGVLFGPVTFTWVLSGLLSVSPGYEPNGGPSRSPASVLSGGPILERGDGAPLDDSEAVDALRRLEPDDWVKELELRRLEGAPFWLARGAGTETRLVFVEETGLEVRHTLPRERVESLLPRLVDAPLLDAAWLTRYDGYYYGDEGERPLPVLRGRFDDPLGTWVYLDPATASVVQIQDGKGRTHRWMYSFLHSMDLPWLVRHRWVRDPIMLFLLAGGTVLCLNGVWLSVRWLRGQGHWRRRGGARPARR